MKTFLFSIIRRACSVAGPHAGAAAGLFLVLGLSGCLGQQDDAAKTSSRGAPAQLRYSVNPARYPYGAEITPNLLTGSGGALTQVNVQPALPEGLVLDAVNGTISGTPVSIVPMREYLITAANGYGSSFTRLSLAITEFPPELSYGSVTTLNNSRVGTPIDVFEPTLGGGATESCVSVPELPAGLSLSPECVLSGTPLVALPRTTFLITASNSGGSATLPVEITITDFAPAFSYSGGPKSYRRGISITAWSPTSTGGVILSCSAAPALPAGLSLSSGCVLSGTPTELKAQAEYTITATNSGGTSTGPMSLEVLDQQPSISFAGTPFTYQKGTAVSKVTPVNAGGTITACTASPALPAGLALAEDCSITGTPSAVAAAANYTIAGSNTAGTSEAVINIVVKDVPPSIAYVPSAFTFMNRVAIPTITPSTAGGAIVSCGVMPPLPAGLTLNPTTCAISGTPSAPAVATNHLVTATNTGGNSSTLISIAVNEVAPVLLYSGSPFTFRRGVTLTPTAPQNAGGTPTACVSSPALPAGLVLGSDCLLSGTPANTSAGALYEITGSNSAGNSRTAITITVTDTPPGISYSGSPYVFTINSLIATLIPTNAGGAVTSCVSAPPLPAGLTLSATCAISGTPTAVSAAADYVITATNSGGSSDALINIRVNDLPPAISYAGSPYTFGKGSAIAATTPNNTGGSIVSCVSNPPLPNGLALAFDCVITGTPAVISAATDYLITATNSGGSSVASVNLTINDIAPVISYPGSPYSYTLGSAITPFSPSNTGGTVTQCAVAPALPTGLSLSANCTLSGTPAALSAAADYTVTATNAGGSGTATLNLKVQAVPPAISFAGSPWTFIQGQAIVAKVPTNTGGPIVSCASVPPLSAGLSLGADCTIWGTPSALESATDHVITATNTGGTSSATVNITVNDVAPTLVYAPGPYSYTIGSPIAPLSPTNLGGNYTSCSSNPVLPAGLSLGNANCVISGTPLGLNAAADYVITGSNSGGTVSTAVNISIVAEPPEINYLPSSYNFVYTKGAIIVPLVPNNTGGPITGCSAVPALPAGLSIAADCTLSGTPAGLKAATDYTITATNSGGFSSEVITITVNDSVPVLAYAGSPYSWTKDVAIVPEIPTNGGGDPVSCTVSPALPAGLSLSSSCVVSGTPSAITPAADYAVTATNTGGSASVTLRIAIPDAAPVLSYAGGPFSYPVKSAIAPLNPTLSGGSVVTCTSSPALPTGLSLSNGCVITGTPSTVSAGTDYAITATNSGGSSTFTIRITSVNVAPQIAYSGTPYILNKGAVLAAQTPSNTGGDIVSCAAAPALPAGLSLSSECVISGTPSVAALQTDYTITATNPAGDGTATVRITVRDTAPAISFAPASRTFTLRTAIATVAPISTGGDITSCSSTPLLPAGLSLSATCEITGAPTAASGATGYTISASNSGGTGSAVLTFTVKDQDQILFYGYSALDGAFNGVAPSSMNIWRVSLDGQDRTALTALGGAGRDSILPSFLASGSKVIFSSMRNLDGTGGSAGEGTYNVWQALSDGTGAAYSTASVGLNDGDPKFSPDGTKIVFASKGADGLPSASYNIYIMNVNGTGLTALTANTDPDLDSVSPVFSPDGTVIYYVSKADITNATNGAPALSSNIWRVNSDGSGRVALTQEIVAGRDSIEPAISPDGLTVVYASKAQILGSDALSYNIWAMDANGDNKQAHTSAVLGNLDSQSPAFSPDGTEIAFVSRMDVNGAAANSFNIWKMAANGTAQVALTKVNAANKDSRAPQYSPDSRRICFYSKMDVGVTASASFNIWVMNESGTGLSHLTGNTDPGLDSWLGAGRIWFSP